jgi:glycosyltransferase involved in cell wall biosynthesis
MTSVSVVMAVYNGRRFLSQQIDSVLHELLPGDELIVIDDASSDDSFEFLQSIASPTLRIWKNHSNSGVIASFERGLQLSSHEIIFLCDQDDIWLPGKRSAVVKEFEQDKNVSIVISDAQVIDAMGQVIISSFMTTRGGFSGGTVATLWRNRYLGCAMAMRRPVLAMALPIPRYVPMHDMWFGMMGDLIGKVVYLSAPLIQYRRHTGNASPAYRQSVMRMLGWRVSLIAAVCIRIIFSMLGFHKSSMKDT